MSGPQSSTLPRGMCREQLELPLFPDPAPPLSGCACEPPAVRPCGHCTHCDTCLDCEQCAGSGCVCECE